MKDYELQCIDYACLKTMEKGGEFSTPLHITTALSRLLNEGYTRGFTSNSGARNYISNLSFEQIEKELLKNIIKTDELATRKRYDVLLGTQKNFDSENLSNAEVKFLLMNLLKEGQMESIKYILNKYPNLYTNLISDFVSTRYYDNKYRIDQLDNIPTFSKENSMLLEKIDNYYNQAQMENNQFYK